MSSHAETIKNAERRSRRLAEAQAGAISKTQTIACGLPEQVLQRKVRTGVLIRVLPGVYVYGGTADTWEQRLWVTQLWFRDGDCFSHTTAARIWRLPIGYAKTVEVTLGKWRDPARRWLKVHRGLRTTQQDTRRVESFRVTSIPRTVMDLGSVVSDEQVEIALDDACFRRLTNSEKVRSYLDEFGGKGCTGASVLRKLLDVRGEGPPCASPQETKGLRFLRKYRFPPPTRQHRISLNDRVIARADFAYPERRLAVEVLGGKWHGRKERWESDIGRQNHVNEAGWQVFYLLPSEMRDDPTGLARKLRAVYRSRPIV